MEPENDLTPVRDTRYTALKAWCWIIGILAVAVLAVIVFCHVAYWLMWIGAATVIILFFVLIYFANKGARQIEDKIDDTDNG